MVSSRNHGHSWTCLFDIDVPYGKVNTDSSSVFSKTAFIRAWPSNEGKRQGFSGFSVKDPRGPPMSLGIGQLQSGIGYSRNTSLPNQSTLLAANSQQESPLDWHVISIVRYSLPKISVRNPEMCPRMNVQE
jgi:hypothetical protein